MTTDQWEIFSNTLARQVMDACKMQAFLTGDTRPNVVTFISKPLWSGLLHYLHGRYGFCSDYSQAKSEYCGCPVIQIDSEQLWAVSLLDPRK